MRSARLFLVLAVSGSIGLAGCGDDGGDGGTGPTPTAGTLTLNLTSPNADDRAIHIRITGSGAADSVSNVQAANASYTIHAKLENGNTAQAAVFGNLTNGALVTFSVPNVNNTGRYTFSVVDAADANNALRTNKGSYTLQVQ